MRFSTKRAEETADLTYYGYRLYNPAAGRWLNRDPLGETDRPNLHSFLGNASVNEADALGLCKVYSSGIRYRVSVAALDSTVKNHEYANLRDEIVADTLSTVAGWGFNPIFPNPPILNSTGPFALWSNLQGQRYESVAAFFFFYVDWDIDEIGGHCGLNIEEDINTYTDGVALPLVTDRYNWGTPEFARVRFRKAQRNPPIGDCTQTMILADAPGRFTSPPHIGTLRVAQKLTVVDTDHGNAPVFTISHTVAMTIDARNRGLPVITFSP
jgi:RHS repeat-associated protein